MSTDARSSFPAAAGAQRPATAGDLVIGYGRHPRIHDELVAGDGTVRPHWRPFLEGLAAVPPEDRATWAEQLNKLVRETGIAHDIFADPDARQRWHVDPVPLLIPAGEWQMLQRALTQRARLFEAILADIYGPQRLMRDGSIPPSLVFSDPTYLRACQNIDPARRLQFYAADVARGADGRWRIIDNHAETLAGTGFALANRMVHRQVVGDLFAACRALRLAPFFHRLQATLTRGTDRGNPAIALLTPGPRHEDYFSHAYLARYLGYLLVEGGDLRIVGDRPYLKTVEGLSPIDLIVRCIEGAQADPLELHPSGFLGPAGLVRATRRNPDVMVNALGSAVVENRGLGAYLPALCRELLGEDLAIADAPRWWLGDPEARRHVLANIERMLLRPVFEGTGRPGSAVTGRSWAALGDDDRRQLIDEIALHGRTLVAEERLAFGTTPSLTPDGLVPRPFAVRLFVAATDDGYEVLPGGLAMTVDPDAAVSLHAPDGETRDVWVLSDNTPPPHVTLWRPVLESAHVERSARFLQSRVADNQFWLGRYAERADWTMRVLRSALAQLADESSLAGNLDAVRRALGLLTGKDGPAVAEPFDRADAKGIEHLARELVSSSARSFGLRRTLQHVHHTASLTRDRLSLEAWRTLDVFRSAGKWRDDSPPETSAEAIELLQDGLASIAAFNGLMHENMTRNYGWRFLDTGRRLERAQSLAELLLALFGANHSEDETARLNYVLELADSFITYRSRYRLVPVLPLVLDLLLLDEANPRSLAFQLATISAHLDALPQAEARAERSEERRMILGLSTRLRLSDLAQLTATEADGARPELASLLGEVAATLPRLSEAITRRYFSLIEDTPARMSASREPLS